MPSYSREKLLKAGIVEKKKKGDIIYGEREEISTIDFVLDGFVSLYRNSRYGEVKVIFICASGEMLNEVVIEKAKTSVAAKALSDVTLLRITREDFQQLLQEDFELVKSVYTSISKKTRRLLHQVGNANRTYPLEKHLASKIWKLARDYGVDTKRGRQIEFEVTVTLLAHMLGAKRESVSRAMSKLKKEGYIIHEKSVLIVPSMETIRTLV